MSDVSGALQRLERAIARLEAAAASRTADNQRLRTEIRQAQGEVARLGQLVDSVSGRLDGAIDRLQSVLEG